MAPEVPWEAESGENKAAEVSGLLYPISAHWNPEFQNWN